jgi:hypothetical protein
VGVFFKNEIGSSNPTTINIKPYASEPVIIEGNLLISGSTSHVTASGNISSSGLLFFSSSETNASNFDILVQDPTTGQVFTTGSVGGGAGGGEDNDWHITSTLLT